MRNALFTFNLVASVSFTSVVIAQQPTSPYVSAASSSKSESDEEARARLLGVLVYTKLSIRFEEVPARDAFSALEKALQVRIVGRYNDDRLGFGIDPKLPISINAESKEALLILEEMLEQCEDFEECTWQLRKGYVEVGTKERLSVPAAQETRTYNIRNFMIEPPQFGSKGNIVAVPFAQRYSCSAIGNAAQLQRNPDGTTVRRKAPEDLAVEIVELVVETIEPGRWDFGEEDASALPPDQSTNANGPAVPLSPSQPNAAPAPQRPATIQKWATIRLWRDELIVKAPDFIHRQVNGYPKPIPPDPLDDQAGS